MQLAGDPWQELKGMVPGEYSLIPLTALEGSWESLPADKASAAYMEANTATHYLIERFGMPKVHELLLHLKTLKPSPPPCKTGFYCPTTTSNNNGPTAWDPRWLSRSLNLLSQRRPMASGPLESNQGSKTGSPEGRHASLAHPQVLNAVQLLEGILP